MKETRLVVLALVCLLSIALKPVWAESPKFKMTTPIPEGITTPDKVKTSIGTLEFFDGVPTQKTAELVYDNLDRMRGVEVFLNGMPAERAGSGPPPGNGDVLIKGAFVSINKGSRTTRMLIGFGAGAAKLETYVASYQITPTGKRLLGEKQVTAKGGKMPGMLVPVAGGAAMGTAATSAAISGGLNVGQEAGPESLRAAAKRTAKRIAKTLSEAFARRGWISAK